MGKIQVNDFIQSFAQKLRQTSGEDIQSFAGSRPKYPMAVVYLGKESAGLLASTFQEAESNVSGR